MKKLIMKDLLKKSIKDLVQMRAKMRKSLYDMKLKNAIRSLTQTHLIAIARKNIARLNTVMKQKLLIVK
jgi:ribosomal protein L29